MFLMRVYVCIYVEEFQISSFKILGVHNQLSTDISDFVFGY